MAADQAVKTGAFHSRLHLVGPGGSDRPQIDRFGQFDRVRKLTELRIVLGQGSGGGTPLPPASQADPHLIFLYTPTSVLMRNPSFDAQGRLVAASVDVSDAFLAAAAAMGQPATRLPGGERAMYDVSCSPLGQPITIKVPSPADIAPAPSG